MSTNSTTVPIPIPANGVMPDQNPRIIGPTGLVSARNFLYRNGRFRSRSGLVNQMAADEDVDGTTTWNYFDYDDSTPERPMSITTFGTDIASSAIVVGTDTGWWHFAPATGILTDITDRGTGGPLTSSQKTEFVVFRSFDDVPADGSAESAPVLIGVNGDTDPAKVWNGSTGSNYADITNAYDDGGGPEGSKMYAKCCASSFNRMIYGNIKYNAKNYPDAVIYSEYLEYDSWQATNIIRLADTPGYIVGMLEFGNMATVVYKSDAIYLMSAIGQPNAPFRVDLKVSGISGPVSPLAVVQVDGYHVFLAGDGDVVMFDGSNARSMGPHLHAYFQKNMDFEKKDMAYGFYDASRKELHFFFPGYSATDVKKSVTINLTNPQMPTLWPMQYDRAISCANAVISNESSTIGQLEGQIGGLEGSIGDYGSYVTVVAVGTPRSAVPDEGEIYYLTGVDDDGEDISLYAKTGYYDLGEVRRWKTLKEIDHLFNKAAGQALSIQLAMSTSGESKLATTAQTITLTTPPYITYHRETDRMLALVISGSVNDEIEWFGSEASIVGRGRR